MGPLVLLEGLAELEGTWCRARGIVGGALGSMEGLMPTTPAQWNRVAMTWRLWERGLGVGGE